MKKQFLALGLVAAIAVPASAEGVYIFGDAGQSKLSTSDQSWDHSKTESTYSFGVGYALDHTYSLELAYRNLGSHNYQDDYEKDTIDMSALQASILANLPVSNTVSIYGRLGVARLTNDWTYRDFQYPEDNDSGSDSKNRALVGVGASVALNKNVSLRAEYNRYAKWNGATTSAVTVGAVYSF